MQALTIFSPDISYNQHTCLGIAYVQLLLRISPPVWIVVRDPAHSITDQYRKENDDAAFYDIETCYECFHTENMNREWVKEKKEKKKERKKERNKR